MSEPTITERIASARTIWDKGSATEILLKDAEAEILRLRIAARPRLSEPDDARRVATGSATSVGYRIEVRDPSFDVTRVTQLADGPVGTDWRAVYFEQNQNPAGVPVLGSVDRNPGTADLLPYHSAVALAWTVIAQNTCLGHALECRLVQYRVRSTYAVYREGVVDAVPIGGSGWAKVELVAEPAATEEGASDG